MTPIGSSAMAFPDALAEGSMLMQYRLERVLGQGGFGITYLAQDTRLEKPTAIKEYFPRELCVRTPAGKVLPKSGREREPFHKGLAGFLEEARTIARFQHAAIVRVNSFFEALGTAFFAMEYEEGESLSQHFKAHHAPWEERELLTLLLPLLEALEKMHAAGYIHRDIKPGNIFIRRDGSPLLLDFGSARFTLGEETRTLTALLTPGYAPFEQYFSSSKRQGPWTDLYALGTVIFLAIARQSPAPATDRSSAIMRGDPDPLWQRFTPAPGRYSHHFLAAILHATRVMEGERTQNVAEFREELLGKRQHQPSLELLRKLSGREVTEREATSFYHPPLPPVREITSLPDRAPRTDGDVTKLLPAATNIPQPSAPSAATTIHRARIATPRRGRFMQGVFGLLLLADVGWMARLALHRLHGGTDMGAVFVGYFLTASIFPLLWIAGGLLLGRLRAWLKGVPPTPGFASPALRLAAGLEILGALAIAGLR